MVWWVGFGWLLWCVCDECCDDVVGDVECDDCDSGDEGGGPVEVGGLEAEQLVSEGVQRFGDHLVDHPCSARRCRTLSPAAV